MSGGLLLVGCGKMGAALLAGWIERGIGAPYTISLDNGTYASGAVRRLGSGTSRLNYEIYRDVGLTGVFGLASSLLGVSGVGTGVSIPTQVFGRIATGQSVAPGNYTDQITVTIDY